MATAPDPAFPTPTKPPLKANVFETLRGSNTQLLPLFPYSQRGDIVVCSAALQSDGSPAQVGYFVHTNSVDEITISHGSTGFIRTGDVYVGAPSHGVGGDLGDQPFFAVLTVTQRQRDEGDQPEAMSFVCDQCGTEILRHQYDGAQDIGDRFKTLPTIAGSLAASRALNASDEKRTCPSCGHVSAQFPTMMWGWDRYVHNTSIVERARLAIEEAR